MFGDHHWALAISTSVLVAAGDVAAYTLARLRVAALTAVAAPLAAIAAVLWSTSDRSERLRVASAAGVFVVAAASIWVWHRGLGTSSVGSSERRSAS